MLQSHQQVGRVSRAPSRVSGRAIKTACRSCLDYSVGGWLVAAARAWHAVLVCTINGMRPLCLCVLRGRVTEKFLSQPVTMSEEWLERLDVGRRLWGDVQS